MNKFELNNPVHRCLYWMKYLNCKIWYMGRHLPFDCLPTALRKLNSHEKAITVSKFRETGIAGRSGDLNLLQVKIFLF